MTGMAKGKIYWRDTFDTWPSLTIKVQLAPWHWRLWWYRDDLDPCFLVEVGPLTLYYGANRGHPFALERSAE